MYAQQPFTFDLDGELDQLALDENGYSPQRNAPHGAPGAFEARCGDAGAPLMVGGPSFPGERVPSAPTPGFVAMRERIERQSQHLLNQRAELARQEHAHMKELMMMEHVDAALVDADERMEHLEASRNEALSACARLAHERDAAIAALAEERSDREAAEAMLADASEYIGVLTARNRELERTMAALLVECEEVMAASAARGSWHPPPTPAGERESFGLKKTRAKVEEAVEEAFKCGEEECKKKIRALRLKWHPVRSALAHPPQLLPHPTPLSSTACVHGVADVWRARTAHPGQARDAQGPRDGGDQDDQRGSRAAREAAGAASAACDGGIDIGS